MNKILTILLLIWIMYGVGHIAFINRDQYFNRYFNDNMYQQLERLYNNSQYRQSNPTSIIADEIVFRYAAAAYIRGIDPILINSEHTPLGKYFIGLSFLWFQNDIYAILFSAILSLISLWLLSRLVLGNSAVSMIPIALWASEPLFQNQLRVTPLLDIIQLPWIFLSLYAFNKRKYFWTAVCIGLTAATKTVVPSILLLLTFFLFFVYKKQFIYFFRFIPWLSVSFLIFLASYTRTFLNGYTLWDFFGFQKWIILYQESKLIFPFSFWKLLLFNQWQTWWGDLSIIKAIDWRITWPIIALLPIGFICTLRNKLHDSTVLLILWVITYEVFLSAGAVVTRFFLPLLPILYILSVKILYDLTKSK